MWSRLKRIFFVSMVVALLGGVIGGITWIFLFGMNIGLDLLWYLIPRHINLIFYPVLVCGIGGLLIGLWEKGFGSYPSEMREVMSAVKSDKKIPYNNLHIIGISALLPLVFGGSVGPEAGLISIIAGLCFWFSDKFKFAFSEIDGLPEIGMAATVGIIFGSPFFGFANQVEDENKINRIPKNEKTLMYFIGILGGFGIFFLLSNMFGGTPGLGRFPLIKSAAGIEWLAVVPLALIGSSFGVLYFIFKKGVHFASRSLKNMVILKAVLGGIILGAVGIVLPYTMFSGEHQMAVIMNTWQGMGFMLLMLTGILKLLIGNICLEMGWRGGNIFPVVFSGVTIGYACAIFLPIDPIFCVAVVTAALTSAVLRKPLGVILLLLVCFPVNAIIPISIGAIIGGAIPIPEFLTAIHPTKTVVIKNRSKLMDSMQKAD